MDMNTYIYMQNYICICAANFSNINMLVAFIDGAICVSQMGCAHYLCVLLTSVH